MNFYFDESGDFRVPATRSDHAVGIAMGVVIPDETEVDTFRRFDGFVAGLPSSAFRNGEPKGNLLDDAARRQFTDFVRGCDSLLVCPTMLDLTALAGRTDIDVQGSVIAKLQTRAGKCKHQKMREQVELLTRQFRKLSIVQCLRLATWARCIMRSVHDSLIVHSGQRFHGSWHDLKFEIDPVQRGAESREEQVFNTMVLAWICAWSEAYPFTTLEDIHGAKHPFVQNFDTPEGIDFGKMIRGNLHYPPSHKSKGIQIADIAASIISDATHGVANAVDLENYGMMMTASIGKPLYAVGLFSFVQPDVHDWQKRFYGLPESIDAAKKSV